MSAAWNRGLTPIGIDIGASRMKAVQLTRTRRGWRAVAMSALDRLDAVEIPGDADVERLAEVLDRAGFLGNDVVVGAPRARLHTAVLDLPPRKSGAPLEQICQAEVSRMFRLIPGTYELHAWEVPSLSSRSATTQMAASALPWSDATELVAPFDRVGLNIVAVDLGAEATSRACAEIVRGLAELAVVADIGETGIELLVFRAGERVYYRRLEGLGLLAIATTIARKLGIPVRGAGAILRRCGLGGAGLSEAPESCPARAAVILREQIELVLQEVLASVAYALDRFPGESISGLRLVGGGANVPGIARCLSEISGLDVATIGPDAMTRGLATRPRSAADPSYITSLGHALWGSTP